MNDLQLLALLTMLIQIERGGVGGGGADLSQSQINSSADAAERILFTIVDRQSKHSTKHRLNPNEDCFHCKCIALARKEQQAKTGIIQ